MKRRRLPMAGRVHARLRSVPPAYFLWPAAFCMEACDEARSLIEAYATCEDINGHSLFLKRCRRTIRMLRCTKQEIRRLAKRLAEAKERYYQNA